MSALLARVADIMRRCDPEYCESHSVEQTTDEEWDELLMEVEENYDPTPWCSGCGAMRKADCDCGEIAANE